MYVFIFLGKKDNFGVFEEIFGDFWDCDHYVLDMVEKTGFFLLRRKQFW